MKTSYKLAGLVAAMMLATTGTAMAQEAVVPYVQSSNGQTVVNSTGLCWRTGFWTPALAEAGGPNGVGCQCDKDILSASACTIPEPAPEPAPVVTEEPKVEKVTLSADTLFAFDSAKLTDEGKSTLDDLVSKMAGLDIEVILSTGYTDRIGTEAYNQKLSERRAAAVKEYMVSKGVAADLVQTEGRGEADPLTNCPRQSAAGPIKTVAQLLECLGPDRRAVIEVIGTRTAQ